MQPVSYVCGGPSKPIIRMQCLWCRTQPSALVRASDGLSVPGICVSLSSPFLIHSCRAKYWMSMCWVRLVGFSELAMNIAALLSTYIDVGPFCVRDMSFSIVRTNFVSFPASIAAINSALVDDVATVGCLFDL